MGGCAAINCSNHSRNKCRMFRFPSDVVRRREWAINCRRDGWVPGPRAELCSVHFEESQYEQHRADKVKKLKPNAVPTLFDFHSSPASKHNMEKSLHKSESILDCALGTHVCRGKARERARLKKTALPSLCLPVSAAANTAEKFEGKPKAAQKMQGEIMNEECRKKKKPNMKKNMKFDNRDGDNALLLLSSADSSTDHPRSLLKKNTDNRKEQHLSAKITERQSESISTNSETTKSPRKVPDNASEECFQMKSGVTQEDMLSVFRDEVDSEVSANSEEIIFLENETEDSKEILKEKLRKLTVCYKNSQRKLKEYERLCKLYVKEVTALREVINNLKQINSIADNNYFEAKS